MEQLLFDLLFWGVFVGGGVIFVIFAVIMAVKQYKRDTAKQKQNNVVKETEFAATTIKATVVDQSCCVKTIGMKLPKTVKEFVVVFQTESGDMIKFSIPEEMYDGFEHGQTGILTIADGELYGFELEERADVLSCPAENQAVASVPEL